MKRLHQSLWDEVGRPRSRPRPTVGWALRRLGLGLVLFLGHGPAAFPAETFSNRTAIDLADGAPARRYPSALTVSGVEGSVTEVLVTLQRLNHRSPDDLDILLVGPRGQKVLLISDAGGTQSLTDVTLTLGDRFGSLLPDNAQIVTGSYKPSNFGPIGTADPFASPAPAGPYGSALSAFNGIDPNGTWHLYIVDDLSGDGAMGRLAEGWSLSIETIAPPRIVVGPQDQAVAPGNAATFQVQATGSGPLSYRWLRNDVPISLTPGGGATLTFSNVTASQAGEYRVRVSNSAGSVLSGPATLYVLGPLALVEEPKDGTYDFGTSNVTLRVTAAGTPPLYYQWFLNESILAGSTNATLVLSNLQAPHGGSYSAVVVGPAVTQGNPCIVTRPSRLRLKAPTLPLAQNHRDQAGTLNSVSGIVAGTSATADKDGSEPSHAGRPGGRSVWYRWVAPRAGITTFHTQGSSFDTLLAIYTNSPSGVLRLLAADEDGGGHYTSHVRFNIEEGRETWIAVDGFRGVGGEFLLSWSMQLSVLPEVAVAPLPQTVTLGHPAKFEVTPANPVASLTYQWFQDGAPIAGATGPVYLQPNVQEAHLGHYSVRLTRPEGSYETPPVSLEIGPDPSIQIARKIGNLSDFGPAISSGFSLAGALGAGPVAGTIVVPVGDDRTHAFRTNEPPSSVPQVCLICSQGRHFYWLKAVDEGSFELSTGGSDHPVTVGVYELTNTLDRLSLVTCSDENGLARFVPRRNVTNIIALEPRRDLQQPSSGSGIVRLAWRLIPPCYTLPPGTNLTLSTAPPQVGPPPHRYQWRRNGQDLSGATTTTLFLANLQPSDAGTYTVQISNSATQEIKTIAYLNITEPLALAVRLLTTPDPLQPLLQLEARGSQRFVLQSKAALEPTVDWRPVLTNADLCSPLRFTTPLTAPQLFFRAVEWVPPP